MRRPAVLSAIVIFVFGQTVNAAQYVTDNFVVTSPTAALAQEIGLTLEKYRKSLAIEWSGRAMPKWSRPCLVDAKIHPSGSGGFTQYIVKNNRVVTGWRMKMWGSKRHLLTSTIPHEVSHTVFASLAGKQLPRWCDEGAAVHAEGAAELRRYTLRAREMARLSQHFPVRSLFATKEYPDGSWMFDFYAQSYTISKILVEARGKPYFFKYMRAGGDAVQLRRFYDLTPESLYEQWLVTLNEEVRPAAAPTPVPNTSPEPAAAVAPPPTIDWPALPEARPPAPAVEIEYERPVLYMYTTARCQPCAYARHDRKMGLWTALEARFDVIIRDVAEYTAEARGLGVVVAPSWVISGKIIAVGYEGPEWLLNRASAHAKVDRRQPGVCRCGPLCFCGPRCRCRGGQRPCPVSKPPEPVPDEDTFRRLIEEFMVQNADLFRGADGAPGRDGLSGENGQDGHPGAAPTDRQLRAALADFFRANPIDDLLAYAVSSYFDKHRDKFRGADGRDATLPDLSKYLTRADFDRWVRDNPPDLPPIIDPVPDTRHIVIVADKDADYYARLEPEIARAKEHFSGIRIAAPPADFTVKHPQIVLYEGSDWLRKIVGSRAVNEALNLIAREEFAW